MYRKRRVLAQKMHDMACIDFASYRIAYLRILYFVTFIEMFKVINRMTFYVLCDHDNHFKNQTNSCYAFAINNAQNSEFII